MDGFKKIFFIFLLCILTFGFEAKAFAVSLTDASIPILTPQQLIEEGFRLRKDELLYRAWNLYENASNLPEDEEDGYLQLGKIYFCLSVLGSDVSGLEKAELKAREAVYDFPDESDAHRSLGLVLAGQGKLLEARAELSLAAQLNPGNKNIVCDLAAVLLALNEPKEVINYLEGYNHSTGWPYIILAMAWSQLDQPGKTLINFYKAKHLGYQGYWIGE